MTDRETDRIAAVEAVMDAMSRACELLLQIDEEVLPNEVRGVAMLRLAASLEVLVDHEARRLAAH